MDEKMNSKYFQYGYQKTQLQLQGWELLYTVLKVEKVHNLYTLC